MAIKSRSSRPREEGDSPQRLTALTVPHKSVQDARMLSLQPAGALHATWTFDSEPQMIDAAFHLRADQSMRGQATLTICH